MRMVDLTPELPRPVVKNDPVPTTAGDPTVGADLDGTLASGFGREDAGVCISGRTWAEYDDVCRTVAIRMPIYIRGSGRYGDAKDAGEFKAIMINRLGIRKYYEDDPAQAKIIKKNCPDCEVVLVGKE